LKQMRRPKFTLLEVLIALALIVLSLPLLISPFVYMTEDIQQESRAMRLEKAAAFSINSLLIDFHLKKISLDVLEANEVFQVPSEWYKEEFKEKEITGSYTFNKLNSSGKTNQKIEKWQVLFLLGISDQKTKKQDENEKTQFKYQFIVQRAQKQ
jgi:type II secretory pathway pseudopilin PulG